MERITFCGRSTDKGSFNSDMYGCIFHSYNTISATLFFFEAACGPQFEEQWFKHYFIQAVK